MQGALPAPVMLQPQGNFTGAGNVSGPGSFPGAGKVAGHHRCRLSDGTRPNRQPAPAATTAVTADGKHTARDTSPMLSAGLTPPTPSGVSTPSRHAQLAPPAIAPTTPGPHPHLTCGGGIDPAAPPTAPPPPPCAPTPAPHPGHQHSHQNHPPTRTRQAPRHGHTPPTTGPDDMRHTHPTTRSHRSPPERPTAHTQASTHTHGRQAVSGPHTHAQPYRRDHHHQPSQHQPPRHTQASHNHQDHEAPTQHELNHSSATSTQRSDQRKHQTSRRRNNRRHKNLSQ